MTLDIAQGYPLGRIHPALTLCVNVSDPSRAKDSVRGILSVKIICADRKAVV